MPFNIEDDGSRRRIESQKKCDLNHRKLELVVGKSLRRRMKAIYLMADQRPPAGDSEGRKGRLSGLFRIGSVGTVEAKGQSLPAEFRPTLL